MAHGNITKRVIVRDGKSKWGNHAEITDAGIPHRLISERLVGNSRAMGIITAGNGEAVR
jgi:hypothetical protein